MDSTSKILFGVLIAGVVVGGVLYASRAAAAQPQLPPSGMPPWQAYQPTPPPSPTSPPAPPSGDPWGDFARQRLGNVLDKGVDLGTKYLDRYLTEQF